MSLQLLWKNSIFALIIALGTAEIGMAGEPLPGTKPLLEDGDLSMKMVLGLHHYLDKMLAEAPQKRDILWKANENEPLTRKRDRLRRILGVVDERVKPKVEFVGGPDQSALVAEIEGIKVFRVRWAVLPGVDAEGFLIEPSGKPKANLVVLNESSSLPDRLMWARHGCRVLIPTLINRKDELSGNAKLKRQTNIPHREFIYRMAFEMGRTLIGYEVQKALAAVDYFAQQNPNLKIGIAGSGEGGLIALYAGALDERIHTTLVKDAFRTREQIHDEPIDRNVWGLLKEFGDAEVARMHPAGRLQLIAGPNNTTWAGPAPAANGKRGAAPGMIVGIDIEMQFTPEFKRIRPGTESTAPKSIIEAEQALLKDLGVWQDEQFHSQTCKADEQQPAKEDPQYTARHQRQFEQLVEFMQQLHRDSSRVRKDYWAKAYAKPPQVADWDQTCEEYRQYFHKEVIGELPPSTMPLNPRSRQIYDTPTYTGHEVMLDVFQDVFAYGILLLPKNLKPGEKRPVVVCQHGLNGTPKKCIEVDVGRNYQEFARKLVEKGYIVYCPQNPYYGENVFRQVQRKANPLQLSLFSIIIRQHQRTIDWLETLPHVDAKRIGFYGLSYGGKTAMRVPAVEKRYCLSICSGDFNEWIGKNVRVDLSMSYMFTHEYEMVEYNLGQTFNYAEMAYLIAPRPFMVERGHDDGVGIDEMVASEFAKVRYLYGKWLKIPDRTGIDFQPGGHEIFLKGTLEFLDKHLKP